MLADLTFFFIIIDAVVSAVYDAAAAADGQVDKRCWYWTWVDVLHFVIIFPVCLNKIIHEKKMKEINLKRN